MKAVQKKTQAAASVEPYYVNGVLLVNKKHALPRITREWIKSIIMKSKAPKCPFSYAAFK